MQLLHVPLRPALDDSDLVVSIEQARARLAEKAAEWRRLLARLEGDDPIPVRERLPVGSALAAETDDALEGFRRVDLEANVEGDATA